MFTDSTAKHIYDYDSLVSMAYLLFYTAIVVVAVFFLLFIHNSFYCISSFYWFCCRLFYSIEILRLYITAANTTTTEKTSHNCRFSLYLHSIIIISLFLIVCCVHLYNFSFILLCVLYDYDALQKCIYQMRENRILYATVCVIPSSIQFSMLYVFHICEYVFCLNIRNHIWCG